jgi:hypothetical protein
MSAFTDAPAHIAAWPLERAAAVTDREFAAMSDDQAAAYVDRCLALGLLVDHLPVIDTGSESTPRPPRPPA